MNRSFVLWTSTFYPVIGGLQSATLEIAKYFVKNNWDVRIITNKYPRSLPKLEKIQENPNFTTL